MTYHLLRCAVRVTCQTLSQLNCPKLLNVFFQLVKERMEAYEFDQEMIDSFCTDSILSTNSPSKFTARFTQPSHNFINAGWGRLASLQFAKTLNLLPSHRLADVWLIVQGHGIKRHTVWAVACCLHVCALHCRWSFSSRESASQTASMLHPHSYSHHPHRPLLLLSEFESTRLH